MKRLLDLRFVIGIFFTIVSLLLLIHYFFGATESAEPHRVNLWCGILFLVFGTAMILLSSSNRLPDND